MTYIKLKNLYENDPINFINKYFFASDKTNYFANIDELYFFCLCQSQIIFKKLLTNILQSNLKLLFVQKSVKKISFFLYVIDNGALPKQIELDDYCNKVIGFNSRILQDDYYFIINRIYNLLEYYYKKICYGKNFIEGRKNLKINKFNSTLYNKNIDSKYKYISNLKKYIDLYLINYIDGFILLGSYGSQDIIKYWSDLDAIVIIKKEVLMNQLIFNKARKLFKKISLFCSLIDPLAHHKLEFLTPFDIKFYSQTFLPISAYNKSLNFLDKEYNFVIRNNYFDKYYKLINFSKYFNKRCTGAIKHNLFLYKNDLSRTLLLPSLLLQASNINISKKEAFEIYKTKIKQIDTNIVDFASAERKNWNIKNDYLLILSKYLYLLPYVFIVNLIKIYKRVFFYYPKRGIVKKNKFLVCKMKNLLDGVLSRIIYK